MLRRSKRRRRFRISVDENVLSHLSSLCVYKRKKLKFRIECRHVTSLSDDVLTWALDLTTTNMKHLYARSEWGWNEVDKRKEMNHKGAWYLLVYGASSSPQAFTHFRFDKEHGLHVLYCYEIQLESSVQGCGLGRHLMNMMEEIAQQYNMDKVMLTVFKHNTSAVNFFTSLGYGVDEISPSVCQMSPSDNNGECSYEILSKPCRFSET